MSENGHKGGGRVVGPMVGEDTGKVVLRLHHELIDAGQAPPTALSPTFIDQLAEKMLEKLDKAGGSHHGHGGGGGGGRKFLFLDKSDWVKLAISFVTATIGVVGLWFLAVRDQMRDQPNREEVTTEVDAAMQAHEDRGVHPRLEKRLDSIEHSVGTTHDSVIRQEQVLKDVQEDLHSLQERRRPR